jgi:hypothetical protein
MLDPVEVLILDFLEWIGPGPRSYAEAIDVWRASRWRLPVWEEANARGFLTREYQNGVGSAVSVSATGRLFLAEQRRRWPAAAQLRGSWVNGRRSSAVSEGWPDQQFDQRSE